MSKGYVDHIGAFRYKVHTIEAHVERPQIRGAKRLTSNAGIWIILVDGARYSAFPATPDDTEEGIRERIKLWIDEHLS